MRRKPCRRSRREVTERECTRGMRSRKDARPPEEGRPIGPVTEGPVRSSARSAVGTRRSQQGCCAKNRATPRQVSTATPCRADRPQRHGREAPRAFAVRQSSRTSGNLRKILGPDNGQRADEVESRSKTRSNLAAFGIPRTMARGCQRTPNVLKEHRDRRGHRTCAAESCRRAAPAAQETRRASCAGASRQ